MGSFKNLGNNIVDDILDSVIDAMNKKYKGGADAFIKDFGDSVDEFADAVEEIKNNRDREDN